MIQVNPICSDFGTCVSAYPFGPGGNANNITVENNIANVASTFRNPIVGSGPITVNLSISAVLGMPLI